MQMCNIFYNKQHITRNDVSIAAPIGLLSQWLSPTERYNGRYHKASIPRLTFPKPGSCERAGRWREALSILEETLKARWLGDSISMADGWPQNCICCFVNMSFFDRRKAWSIFCVFQQKASNFHSPGQMRLQPDVMSFSSLILACGEGMPWGSGTILLRLVTSSAGEMVAGAPCRCTVAASNGRFVSLMQWLASGTGCVVDRVSNWMWKF